MLELPACSSSEPWIDWLTFEREHAKYAFVHTPQWIAVNESLKSFDPKGELAQRQRPLRTEPSCSEPFKMLWSCVFRSINDAQILSPPALYGRLYQTAPVLSDERKRLHNHAFAPSASQLVPPCNPFLLASVIAHIDDFVWRCQK